MEKGSARCASAVFRTRALECTNRGANQLGYAESRDRYRFANYKTSTYGLTVRRRWPYGGGARRRKIDAERDGRGFLYRLLQRVVANLMEGAGSSSSSAFRRSEQLLRRSSGELRGTAAALHKMIEEEVT